MPLTNVIYARLKAIAVSGRVSNLGVASDGDLWFRDTSGRTVHVHPTTPLNMLILLYASFLGHERQLTPDEAKPLIKHLLRTIEAGQDLKQFGWDIITINKNDFFVYNSTGCVHFFGNVGTFILASTPDFSLAELYEILLSSVAITYHNFLMQHIMEQGNNTNA